MVQHAPRHGGDAEAAEKALAGAQDATEGIADAGGQVAGVVQVKRRHPALHQLHHLLRGCEVEGGERLLGRCWGREDHVTEGLQPNGVAAVQVALEELQDEPLQGKLRRFGGDNLADAEDGGTQVLPGLLLQRKRALDDVTHRRLEARPQPFLDLFVLQGPGISLQVSLNALLKAVEHQRAGLAVFCQPPSDLLHEVGHLHGKSAVRLEGNQNRQQGEADPKVFLLVEGPLCDVIAHVLHALVPPLQHRLVPRELLHQAAGAQTPEDDGEHVAQGVVDLALFLTRHVFQGMNVFQELGGHYDLLIALEAEAQRLHGVAQTEEGCPLLKVCLTGVPGQPRPQFLDEVI
mmetsp:Transcript_31751/g.90169  ORF Transcript_31751/g.90169 Transcript_31751/m.90169 type:complete len:347 (-) Transcript_31751:829-1869(-)